MLKSIIRTMLARSMLGAWSVIRTGELGIERSEAIGIDNPDKPYAGFGEKITYQRRLATLRLGEAVEGFVNWVTMRLGYRDGEVSGMVAWPVPAN